MKTIKVICTCGQNTEIAYFNNNKAGHSKSVKFLEEIKKQYLANECFTTLRELKKLENRYVNYWTRCKMLEADKERLKYLRSLPLVTPAPLVETI